MGGFRKVVAVPKDISYLYERLFSKLSDDGFHDIWSIGSFLVIFIFCTITITLTLTVIFSWCCGWCFEEPDEGSTMVGVLTPAMSRKMSRQMQSMTRHAHTQCCSKPSTLGLSPIMEHERRGQTCTTLSKPRPATKRGKRKRLRTGSVRAKRRSRPPSRVRPKEAPV